ncbi:unnamed protein product [Adineta ricciae]|uniref:G-protein coupled receptors family 1 profile domain-containing protein n=1 Tax=Adineta ricciae TaxID=249248 RepID=A0A814FEI1_ADIRI|nr:unnamed protein product [Adineta ricciae]CAF0984688.1 unnamed protein product [Adineta ricciae]
MFTVTINHSITEYIVSSSYPLVPNIILDFVAIAFCVIAICKTCLFIVWILLRRLLTKPEHKVLFLLSVNMYASILIFNCFCIDMFISMVKGHFYPNVFQTEYDTLWCRLNAYLSNVLLICSLYSTTFQAFHRCLRIICYTSPAIYQNINWCLIGIVIQVLLSLLQPLPLILANIYQYNDYHCQVQFTNWSGMIVAAALVWILPISPTIATYLYTIYFIRRNSLYFTHRQHTRIKRDMTVIRRIVWLIIFIVIFGIPACSTTVVYYLFGYVSWWENYVIWLTFILSFIGVSTVQTFYSPHLRILWSRPSRRVGPTIHGRYRS